MNINLQSPAGAKGASRVLRPVSVPKLPVPAPQPAAEEGEAEPRVVPGASFEERPQRRSWEERLGPVGIAVGSFALCIIVWLLASHFLLK
jgi:hypothetical protein